MCSRIFQAMRHSPISALAILLGFDALGFSQDFTPAPSPVLTAERFNANWNSPRFWQRTDGVAAEKSWSFSENEIQLEQPQGGKNNLLSPRLPKHFELTFDWKVDPQANSGLKYRVRKFGRRWLGVEYQMIDEPIPLKAPSKGSTASIYDLVSPNVDKPLNPAGKWNAAKIVAKGNALEHYLNGSLVSKIDLQTPAWKVAVAKSKFWGLQDFGSAQFGDRLLLTDHGGRAAFRNMRLVELSEPEAEQPATNPPFLGNAFRNSWADQNSIVLWTRTTVAPEMNRTGPQFTTLERSEVNRLSRLRDSDEHLTAQLPADTDLDEMLGACPGTAGQVRLTYFPQANRNRSITTDWVTTEAASDFTAQWQLKDLRPGTRYAAIVEARADETSELSAVVRGAFETAPPANAPQSVSFCMTTCHDFERRDDGLKGHKIYPAMQAMNPDFVVHAGDIEYYDKPHPWAWTKQLMRFKWARIFSMPRNREFYASHSTYFIKDDHDTLKNDCWAGQHYGSVTFAEGVQLFNEEQFPSKPKRYHTVRWGRDLQIWILEGRDYRSANDLPDGPEKSILGDEQKAWLLSTLSESDAAFKLVFSPTPIVGPDRKNKRDNHANTTFAHEGQQLRQAFSDIPNVVVFCGDRHWQYASEDDETGLWEFGCGPGSEKHQLGWKAGDQRPVHRFLRVAGGFLSGQVLVDQKQNKSRLVIRHHTVGGEKVSRFVFESPETDLDDTPTEDQ